jgi:regulatory LuxR family protein
VRNATSRYCSDRPRTVDAEIARELFVSDETVKTHVGRIFTKLGVRDRTQGVIVCYECGLVEPRARS